MPVKTIRNKDATKLSNRELYDESRRVPIVRKSIYRIVFTYLQKAYDAGKINDVAFEDVNKEVRKHFPDSKFNPFHLAHYKHKFLVEAP